MNEFYCIKAQRKLNKVITIPCSDCKKTCKENMNILDMDKYCMRFCQYPIMEELLTEEQKKLLIPENIRIGFSIQEDFIKRGVRI